MTEAAHWLSSEVYACAKTRRFAPTRGAHRMIPNIFFCTSTRNTHSVPAVYTRLISGLMGVDQKLRAKVSFATSFCRLLCYTACMHVVCFSVTGVFRVSSVAQQERKSCRSNSEEVAFVGDSTLNIMVIKNTCVAFFFLLFLSSTNKCSQFALNARKNPIAILYYAWCYIRSHTLLYEYLVLLDGRWSLRGQKPEARKTHPVRKVLCVIITCVSLQYKSNGFKYSESFWYDLPA